MMPQLKLDLLADIAAKVTVPLVLHGGSANSDAGIAEAVTLGITKINISSDIKVAYHAAMQATAANKIRLFRADGKAALY